MRKFGLHITANTPKGEWEETDLKERTAKELFEAIGYALLRHDDATSFVFVVTTHDDQPGPIATNQALNRGGA